MEATRSATAAASLHRGAHFAGAALAGPLEPSREIGEPRRTIGYAFKPQSGFGFCQRPLCDSNTRPAA
jgi:hypothetical protein